MTFKLDTKRNLPIIAIIVAVLAIAGAWTVGNHEVKRTAGEWDKNLQRAAQEQSAATENWIKGQQASLSSLAENPTVQIYFALMNATGKAQAEKEYLDNLLTAQSAKLGLQPQINPLVKDPNLKAEGGIALLDNNGQVIAASQGLPELDISRVQSVARNTSAILDMPEDSTARAMMVTPVYGIQTDPSAEAQVGTLVSIVPDAAIAQLIKSSPTSGITLQLIQGDAVDMKGGDFISAVAPVTGTQWQTVASADKNIVLADATRFRGLLMIAAACVALAAAGIAYAFKNSGGSTTARLQSTNKLIELLGSVVDKQDPYASEHSAKVATISEGLAKQMKVDANTKETTILAAKLMNIGKANVPSEMLTRPGALTTQELFTIRNSMMQSAEMLRGINFDGPVVETLEQTQEWMDGRGPQKLRGNQIMIPARIISVANSYVAMTSARSHREAMSPAQALHILANDDARFDPIIVSALGEYVRTQGKTVEFSAARSA